MGGDDVLRRLRGMAGVGTTWALSWGAIGALIGAVLWMVSGDPSVLLGAWVSEWGVGMGLYGLVSGVGFGGLLTGNESRRTLFELPLGRTVLWGALGAVAVPVFFGSLGMFEAGTTLVDVLGAIGVTTVLGAVSAPATVTVALRAAREEASEALADPDRPRALP